MKKIRPSSKPTFLKIFIYFLIYFISIYFLKENPDLLKSLNKFSYKFFLIFIDKKTILDNLNYFGFNYLYLYLTIIISFFTFISNLYLKLSHHYIIGDNRMDTYFGIINKSSKSASFKNIKNLDVQSGNIVQIITGVRDIGVEIDGMEGYDIMLKNVSNPFDLVEKMRL